MNVGKFLTKSALTYPEKLAIVHGEKRLTYSQFNARSNKLSNALHRLGLEKGDNVAVLTYNYPETLESIFACFKAGLGAVPINFRLHPKEFAFIIHHCEAKSVIVSEEFNESIIEVRHNFPNIRNIISLNGAGGQLLSYEELISSESNDWADVDVEPDHVGWIFYTSGTTGRPKGAMLTHRNLVAMSMNFYADMCALGPSDAVLHAAPLSHGSGLYALPNIGKAALNVILKSKSFTPELVFQTIEEYKITNMFAAPTMLKLLIDHPSCDQYDHSSMRCLNYGGAPMYVEDLKKAIRKLGPCLVQLFGQGETPMTITYLPTHDHVLAGTDLQIKRLASAGIQRTDVEVKIFDGNDCELSTGQLGEIVCRSDIVMKGYWKNAVDTEKSLSNGWLHTGDLGYIDQNGYLFIMDRAKDMIISGGENIYSREIEEVIIKHPAVRECAVIGVPDPKWGEAIKAIVSLMPSANATEQELIDFCADNIASYKKPKSIDIINDLPKNNYGKIVKKELRKIYWEGRSSSII